MVKLIQRLLRLITLFICLSIYTRICMKDASNTKCSKHALQEKKKIVVRHYFPWFVITCFLPAGLVSTYSRFHGKEFTCASFNYTIF